MGIRAATLGTPRSVCSHWDADPGHTNMPLLQCGSARHPPMPGEQRPVHQGEELVEEVTCQRQSQHPGIHLRHSKPALHIQNEVTEPIGTAHPLRNHHKNEHDRQTDAQTSHDVLEELVLRQPKCPGRMPEHPIDVSHPIKGVEQDRPRTGKANDKDFHRVV
jgi:hypothetical protein